MELLEWIGCRHEGSVVQMVTPCIHGDSAALAHCNIHAQHGLTQWDMRPEGKLGAVLVCGIGPDCGRMAEHCYAPGAIEHLGTFLPSGLSRHTARLTCME
jgi:hypothetical protein